MDVTKETMTQHFQAYDKFKDEITDISSQADEAIKVLKYYDDEKEETKKGGRQLERVIEKAYDEDERNDKKSKPSQEG